MTNSNPLEEGGLQAFDELVLLKRGGRVMYTGPTGHNSKKMVAYFENIPDVPPLKDGINPGEHFQSKELQHMIKLEILGSFRSGNVGFA